MTRILITGATSGIGKALTQASVKQGWEVFACGRNQHQLAELQKLPLVTPLKFDVSDANQCMAALSGLQFDIMVLNAGTCEYVDLDEWNGKLFQRVFDANFFGVVNCLQALLPDMREGSQLAIVDSLARLLPFTRSQAYGASKAAIHYLTKCLEVDLKARGVHVQSISPGFVRTPLTEQNDFDMPFRISAEQAAASIIKGLEKRRSSIYFPTLFALMLRTLSLLPTSWQTTLCRRMKSE
ncbi:SDR family NAD(P)-dependent oxidoreductase [Bowmanella dokdonensis]|uniref:SDR family NAD(P)-dependent oxidoreductase n=1 Tax=Bowmanella dokdonensis TaxID=751969 RepID=A0A939DRN3_9ALTE|nr:SDR family NAD(P)-dependent oxidoreductase [Bowmanella dokdonensis]MBN7827112.1 SDR family NAD(P)-dependent oxidoreductase [Bowmanella dokdonensis]